MRNLILLVFIGFIALGYFWYKDESSNLNEIDESGQESQASQSADTDTKSEPVQEASSAATQAGITFKSVGPFQVASVSKEKIISERAKGHIINGIQFKVDFAAIRANFQNGFIFKAPTVDGRTINIIPKAIDESNDGTTVAFEGESSNLTEKEIIEKQRQKERAEQSANEEGSQPTIEEVLNKVVFVFTNGKLYLGHMSIEGKRFEIERRGDHNYLLELSPDSKID